MTDVAIPVESKYDVAHEQNCRTCCKYLWAIPTALLRLQESDSKRQAAEKLQSKHDLAVQWHEGPSV